MNKNSGTFGLGVSSASAPTVTFPASAASAGIDAKVNSEAVKVTNGLRDTTVGRYITGTDSTASVTTLAFADALGLMLKGALGSDTVTGTDPYTHDFVLGESLAELKFWQQVGASNAPLQLLSGAKVNRLAIEAQGVTPPSVTLELAGTAATWLSSTSWSGPAFDPEDGWFTTAGAQVKIALSGDTPGSVPAYMALDSFSCEITSDMTPLRQFGSVDAAKQVEGTAIVTASISGTTSDTEVYRVIKTGSASGTGVSSAIITGALEITFPHTVEDDYELTIKFPAIPWDIDALGVDVDGGPFELALSTAGAIAADGTSIEVVLINGVASY